MWQLHLCTRHGMSASHCCCTAVTKQKHGFVYRHAGYTSYLYGDVWGMVYSGLFPLKLVIKIVSPPNVFFLEFFPITPDTPRRTRVFRQIFMDILWFGEQPYRRNFWQLSHGGTHWWFQDGAQLKTLWCYPLVIQHCHGKSTFLIGKPSISMGHFPWLC